MTVNPVFNAKKESLEFILKAQKLVYERVKKHLEDMESDTGFDESDVKTFWFSSDASGWEVRLGTTLSDNVHYRVVHEKATQQTSLEVYHKFDTKIFIDKDEY